MTVDSKEVDLVTSIYVKLVQSGRSEYLSHKKVRKCLRPLFGDAIIREAEAKLVLMASNNVPSEVILS